MAETLGSLCDKLTIVKLKQFHTEDADLKESLGQQEIQLIEEVNQYINDALSGIIPVEKLSFAANKVIKGERIVIKSFSGSLGQLVSELAKVNCDLWHEQEKVFEFATILEEEKNGVVRRLAIFNLERVNCIDEIDNIFKNLCIR